MRTDGEMGLGAVAPLRRISALPWPPSVVGLRRSQGPLPVDDGLRHVAATARSSRQNQAPPLGEQTRDRRSTWPIRTPLVFE